MTSAPHAPAPKAGFKTLVADVRRFWKFAAKVGAFLAIVCHLLPAHYRPICDAFASFCTGGN